MNFIGLLDWYVFFLLLLSCIPFTFFFLFATSGWRFLQKEVVTSPYSTSHTTLVYSGEWGVWWKPAFLWENWLSTVTSFPSLELITVASTPHLPITPVFMVLATAELTRTPLIWAGREGVALSTKLPSLFFWCHLASNHFSNTWEVYACLCWVTEDFKCASYVCFLLHIQIHLKKHTVKVYRVILMTVTVFLFHGEHVPPPSMRSFLELRKVHLFYGPGFWIVLANSRLGTWLMSPWYYCLIRAVIMRLVWQKWLHINCLKKKKPHIVVFFWLHDEVFLLHWWRLPSNESVVL